MKNCIALDCLEPLVPPILLTSEIPVTEEGARTVLKGRIDAADILAGRSDRLLVVVGPCSIHCPATALEYAAGLRAISEAFSGELCIVMRAYLEKPRTTVGWKGLVNDPDMNSSFDINRGLRIARQLLVDLTNAGMPLATEILGTFSPEFFNDCMSLGSIGARTTESQLHRELSSGLPFPAGFKNSTDGNVTVAVDAVRAAQAGHHFIGMSRQGLVSIVHTTGNPDGFVILRGGSKGPNYDREHVQAAKKCLQDKGQNPAIMIDCSHGNSEKNFKNQSRVARAVADQIRQGENVIRGVMIESNINEGNQAIPPEGPSRLEYGVSVTDGCISLASTATVLAELAAAVRARRQINSCVAVTGTLDLVQAASLQVEAAQTSCGLFANNILLQEHYV